MRATGVLSDMARAEIADLAAVGIIPTPDEVVMIDYLAKRVETPEVRLNLARGRPVFLGRVALWPLTLYAVDFLDRIAPHLPAADHGYAVAYAMAFGYSERGELDIGPAEARAKIRAWAAGLRCTRRQIEEAVRQVDAEDQAPEIPKDPTGKPMTLGECSAFLAATNGASPEFWERRCAHTYAAATMTMFILQNNADGQPTKNDPKIRAELALGLYVEKLKRKYLTAHVA